jgi:phytoene dehydrogenase-like protein
MWPDVERSSSSIATFSDADARTYPAWLSFWERAGGIFSRHELGVPPTTADLRRQVQDTEDEIVLDWILDRSPADLLNEYFESDEVKAAVTITADTRDLDAPGNLTSWAVFHAKNQLNPANQGIPIGGMGGLSGALANAARAFGARIRLGAQVDRIALDESGRVEGVVLQDGQFIRARTVVSNADPRRTFFDLVGREALNSDVTAEIDGLECESASIKFHAAVSELPDFTRFLGSDADPRYLASIRMCPSLDYYRVSLAESRAGIPSSAPILHIQIPTVYDDSIAPAGSHILSVWAKFEPTTQSFGSWDDVREQQGQLLIDMVTEYAPNFRRSIIDWLVYTPADLERRVFLTGGNIHHSNHAPDQVFADRLFGNGGHRTPISGLYLSGAGTHPGGNVNGAPGYNAAHCLLADLGFDRGMADETKVVARQSR